MAEKIDDRKGRINEAEKEQEMKIRTFITISKIISE